MRFIYQLLSFLLVQVAFAEDPEIPPELTPEELASTSGFQLVEFFSPYCSHCKELAPKWQQAYRNVGGSATKGFSWASFNCIENGDACTKQKIQGYPTIRIYKDGKPYFVYTRRGNDEEQLTAFAQDYIDNGESAFNDEVGAKLDLSEFEDGEKSDNTGNDKPEAAVIKDNFEVIEENDLTSKLRDGKWIIFFVTDENCEACDKALNFFKQDDMDSIATNYRWAKYSCMGAKGSLCSVMGISTFPTLRIYDQGVVSANTEDLKTKEGIKSFLETKLSNAKAKKPIAEPSTSTEVPKEQGPHVPYPTNIEDYTRFPMPTDPAELLFGSQTDYNDRMPPYKDINAPMPKLMQQKQKVSYADSQVHELTGSEFMIMVKGGVEPWTIKFHSPKCGHCKEMAPEYEKMAQAAEGIINIGAVDCDQYADVCKSQHIKAYPTIYNYVGKYRAAEYVGEFKSEAMFKYSKKGGNAMITEVTENKKLAPLLVDDFDNGLTSFLYIHDKSVTEEDWDSLADIAHAITPWGGRIYHTDKKDLRQQAGINYRGNGLIHVAPDVLDNPDPNKLVFTPFPLFDIPKRMRNIDEVSSWAYRMKWLTPQKLDPEVMQSYNNFTMIYLYDSSVKLSHTPEFRDFYKTAVERMKKDLEARISRHDEYRIERMKQVDNLLAHEHYKDAFTLSREPLVTPIVQEISFAYMDAQACQNIYAKNFNNMNFGTGTVLLADFYNGIYVHTVNNHDLKFEAKDINKAKEFLENTNNKSGHTEHVKHFSKKMSGIPKPQAVVLKDSDAAIHPLQQNSASVGRVILEIIIVAIVLSTFYIYVCRPVIFPWINKQRGYEQVSTNQ